MISELDFTISSGLHLDPEQVFRGGARNDNLATTLVFRYAEAFDNYVKQLKVDFGDDSMIVTLANDRFLIPKTLTKGNIKIQVSFLDATGRLIGQSTVSDIIFSESLQGNQIYVPEDTVKEIRNKCFADVKQENGDTVFLNLEEKEIKRVKTDMSVLLFFDNFLMFPTFGDGNTMYIDRETNRQYRYDTKTNRYLEIVHLVTEIDGGVA